MFKLSQRSLARLEGVNEQLAEVIKEAIGRSPIDFGVTCGLRSEEEQKALVEKGASKTMKSKHLDGLAVDIVCYIEGKVCWEAQVYDEVADVIANVAGEVGVPIRWGGAWQVPDIRKYPGTMEDAAMEYIDLRRSQGKRPFIDAPHFEVNYG